MSKHFTTTIADLDITILPADDPTDAAQLSVWLKSHEEDIDALSSDLGLIEDCSGGAFGVFAGIQAGVTAIARALRWNAIAPDSEVDATEAILREALPETAIPAAPAAPIDSDF